MDHQPLHRTRVQRTDEPRLDAFVAQLTGWGRRRAQRVVRDGAVFVDGRRQRVPATRLPAQTEVVVWPPQDEDRAAIDEGALRVIHEDEHLLVVDKPAGLPTQPPPRGGDALSLRVATYLGHPPGEVHRLDRDASGLVIYGRSREATSRLAAAFRRHRLWRAYLAIARTAVRPVAELVQAPLLIDGPRNVSVSGSGLPASTAFVPLDWDADGQRALLRATLQTGRTHQIRVHASWAIGPLAGDQRYGDPLPPIGRVALHAAGLRLRHPVTGTKHTWVAPPPPAFLRLGADDDRAPMTLPDDWAARPDPVGAS